MAKKLIGGSKWKNNLGTRAYTIQQTRAELNRIVKKVIVKRIYQSKYEGLLGYTMQELREHLKSTLPEGYTWEDYCKVGTDLDIDHIVPISAFDFVYTTDPGFKAAWALSNLRIIPREENREKNYTSDSIYKNNHKRVKVA
jgi:5-methylcytosine-specific restriction endonuclease McrA